MTFINLLLFMIQIIVCVLLVACVLFQSSDEDSLSGIGAGAAQPNSLSHKTSMSFVAKLTVVLGIILMFNSFLLASISTHKYNKENNKIKDYLENNRTTKKTEKIDNGEEKIDKANNNIKKNNK